jgi:hypothetical protein
MTKQLLLVVGPGRSGTSVFSAIGQRLGYHIPLPEVQANETNPKGFGEPQWVVDFHTRLLGASGVLITDARPEAWSLAHAGAREPRFHRELRRWLEQEFAEKDDVLVKDPRTLWFFDLWQQVAHEIGVDTHFVTMLRHPAEVVLSRQTWYSQRVPPTGVLTGWMNTMLGTERLTRGLSRTFVDFDQLLDDWQGTFEKVDHDLGTGTLSGATPEQVADADTLIDPALRRSVASWGDVEIHTRLRLQAEEIWQTFQELIADPVATQRQCARLSEHVTAYEEMYAEAEAIATYSTLAQIREERAAARRKVRRARRSSGTGSRRASAPPPGLAGVAVRAARLVPVDWRRAIPHDVRRRMLDTLRPRAGREATPGSEAASRPIRALGPRESWTERQDFVLDLLQQGGIRHFAVPQGQGTWSVGIAESDRRPFLRLLATRARQDMRCTAVDERGHTHATFPAREVAETTDLLTCAAVNLEDTTLATEGGMRPSASYRCQVEFWTRRQDAQLEAPGRNQKGIRAIDPTTVDGSTVVTPSGGRPVATSPVFSPRAWDEVDFPVDVVFLWVDDSDPQWQALRQQHLGATDTAELHRTSLSEARFRDRDELRYALRSVHYYAPWVRRIHLVTAGQRPDWLDATGDEVTLVDHRDIFDEGDLPTFNSNAIISRLHHIPGIADHYILMNDDVFLSRPVAPDLFFDPTGAPKFFLSPRQIPSERVPDETALDSARRAVRELVLRDRGTHVTQLLYHTPHPQLRSWHEELEAAYPDLYARTAQNRFRHPSDLEPLLLHDYLGYLDQRAQPGSIRYRYTSTGSQRFSAVLDKLLREPEQLDTFCLNDVALGDEINPQRAEELLEEFLTQRFPVAAPWERDTSTAVD